jgi:energy-coupling factor transporter transmembrane protein EcfT
MPDPRKVGACVPVTLICSAAALFVVCLSALTGPPQLSGLLVLIPGAMMVFFYFHDEDLLGLGKVGPTRGGKRALQSNLAMLVGGYILILLNVIYIATASAIFHLSKNSESGTDDPQDNRKYLPYQIAYSSLLAALFIAIVIGTHLSRRCLLREGGCGNLV